MSAGTEFNPIGQSFDELYGTLRQFRDKEPIFFSERFGLWVLTRFEDIVSVMTSDCFSVQNANQVIQGGKYCPEATAILAGGVSWIDTPHIQSEEGETHQRFRRAIQGVMTPNRIKSLEPGIRKICNELIDKFIRKGHCEFVSEFSYPLPMLAIFLLIGLDDREIDIHQLSPLIDDMFRLFMVPLTPEQQVAAARHTLEFQQFIHEKIIDRRKNPRNDLLSELLQNWSTGPAKISDDELVIMFTNSFMGAGHETTKSSLTNSMWHLLSNPEHWQYVKNHPERISEVVEECLRLDTPLLGWYRTCVKETVIGGVSFREGDTLVAMFGSANHDERKFENPDALCPARGTPIRHLTFNTGKHTCLGAPLARLEIRVAFELLSTRLKELRLNPEYDVVYEPSFATRGIRRLELQWNANTSDAS